MEMQNQVSSQQSLAIRGVYFLEGHRRRLKRRWQGPVILTFRGPCIVICSYNESQRDALFLKFIW